MDIKGINISGTNVSSIPKDPHFQNVSLLLHLNNNLTDTSPRPKTVIAPSGAVYNTGFKKFGSHSLNITASINRVIKADITNEFQFGLDNFTIECWIFPNGASAGNDRVFSSSNFAAGESSISLGYNSSNVWSLFISTISAGSQTVSPILTPTLGDWTHIAVVRIGSTITIYQNGVSTGSLEVTGSVTNPNYTQFMIGAQFWSSAANYTGAFNGYIDEFRITKGVGRYSSNFTPPTEPFPDR